MVATQLRNGVLAMPSSNNIDAITKQIKRLTSKELEEKRQKGLCFWCDEKFTPSHRCNRRQIYMLSIVNEELEEPSEERCLSGGVMKVLCHHNYLSML